MSRSVLAAGLACLLVMFGSASAEIYQWRDASGKLHFSDKKPKQQAAKDISDTLGDINVDQSAVEREKLERLFKPETPEEKALRQQEAGRQAYREEKRKEQCEQARNYLDALKGPVYFVREDGSSYDISEAERRQRVVALQAQIRQYCP
ncbi:DUF4124 domain-containing protein [Aestuariicella sp. G3-2]|uniref:DUF4124 domain-containing protein n=1 Tax=Pseudomaricurvus albidus TaxID=2842452 RepID=UPI001C0C0775|nr:DUF4124 domain-containing protein [Aestuariicella albida]